MRKCSKCGAETNKNAKYCKACGANLAGAGGSLNDKKARVLEGRATWHKPVAIAAAVVLILAVAWMGKGIVMAKRMGGNPVFPPDRTASTRLTKATPVQEQGGDVRIPLNTVEDGNAHFFSYAAPGKTVTFFVMKASDGSFRTALDACVACNHAKLGYRQEGGVVVCNNCGMAFRPTDIGMARGGCNPIAINRTLDAQMVVLKAKDLEDGVKYF
jgi:hypothetical protein